MKKESLASQGARMIGPYTVLERIGEGGMGEVVKANDSRLDRLVAIKTLKRDATVSEDTGAIRRFQREAQLAAQLNHPGIVQVYDVLRVADQNHIVMEYVPGLTLRQLLNQGPLPLEEALDLAQQITTALYQAHLEGIVHRDLKAENILVNGEGRIKISDFGIAKPTLPEGENEALTQSRAIIGTCYAMSPEQAQGKKIDYRTDLFSLGALLYELFAGFSPFKHEEQVDTLYRIVHHQQDPIMDHCKAVPRALSDLVDHLLEKRPELRPRHAHWVAEVLHEIKLTEHEDTLGTLEHPTVYKPSQASCPDMKPVRRIPRVKTSGFILLGLLAATSMIWFPNQKRGSAELLYVVIEKPVLDAENKGLALLTLTAELAINQALLSRENIFPLDISNIRNSGGTVREITRASAADELIRFEIKGEANDRRLVLRRFRGSDGGLLWLTELAVPKHDMMDFSRGVMTQIDQAYADRPKRKGSQLRAVMDGDDYAAYLSLYQSLQNESESLDTIAGKLAEIRRRSPQFVEAYLLASRVAYFRFNDTRDPTLLEHGLQLADQAKAIDPDQPGSYVRAFDLALLGDQLDRAERELKVLQRLRPEGTQSLKLAGRLAERRGDVPGALATSREVVERHPSVHHLYQAANLHLRQGLYDQARVFYQRLLRKDAGFIRAHRMLANLELLHGDLHEAIRLLSELLAQKPSLGTLVNLGIASMLLGEHAEAVQYFDRAESMAPRNPVVKLNRADGLWLAGEQEAARRAYEEILVILKEEPVGSEFLGTKAQALAHLGRNLEAVQTIQAALKFAPENPEVAYAAALVHTLVGDHTSAVAHGKLALQGGLHRRWFGFTWFDGIRDDLARGERKATNPTD